MQSLLLLLLQLKNLFLFFFLGSLVDSLFALAFSWPACRYSSMLFGAFRIDISAVKTHTHANNCEFLAAQWILCKTIRQFPACTIFRNVKIVFPDEVLMGSGGSGCASWGRYTTTTVAYKMPSQAVCKWEPIYLHDEYEIYYMICIYEYFYLYKMDTLKIEEVHWKQNKLGNVLFTKIWCFNQWIDLVLEK